MASLGEISVSNSDTPLLRVENLVTAFDTEAGLLRAVNDVSFSVRAGSTVGLVGESGCGKSVTALSIMRLLPKPAGRIIGGSIRLNDVHIATLAPDEMHAIRGFRISMIFQEPMTALNPVHRIGHQLAEVYDLHFPEMGNGQIREASIEMLRKVGIPEPAMRLSEYPHQISGGMRQRVMIAMALACEPDILIADEPTTALDVTIQAQILTVMRDLQRQSGMAIIFITHALGVVAEMCEEVLVMYAGTIVEKGPAVQLFKRPAHPYTMGLLKSIPRLENPRKMVLNTIRGMVPGLLDLPEGCRFQNRCPYAMPGCTLAPPPMVAVGDGQTAACYLYPKTHKRGSDHQ
jgi:oligopeptide/dipeptide ABC transporter ATP-binding protein